MNSNLTESDLQNLSAAEFEVVFDKILEGKIAENEIKNFLLTLNKKNLPTNSFLGAVASLKKNMIAISNQENCIDVCGTGGDKLNTLNISTAVAFVAAGAGVKVAKHGNRAVSSLSGSADIFTELGIKFESDISAIKNSLANYNLCFLFAPHFHPILKNLAEIRKNLGVPTIFNFLGPLLNPTNPRMQMIGTSLVHSMSKLASVITQNPQNKAFIVSGFDGMDEISLSAKSHFLLCQNGKIGELQEIDPRDFGFKLVDLRELEGKDAKYNAAKLISLLDGEKSAYRDIVVLNSAFAIYLADHANSIAEAILLAKNAIDSGQSMKIAQELTKKTS